MQSNLSSVALTLGASDGMDRQSLSRLRSRLQGVLLERLDTQFVERVHTLSTNPYSQYAIPADGTEPLGSNSTIQKLVWRVNTLAPDAERHVIDALLSNDFDRFTVRSSGLELTVESRDLTHVSYHDLARCFYESVPSDVFSIRFLTPTAFRRRGEYVFWPEARLVLQSLSIKHSAIVDGGEPGEDLVQALADSARVVRYSVRSQPFPIDGAQIPGFVGTVTYRITGASTLKSYVAMLLRFGEFSGCGVKTSMGMGGMRLLGSRDGGRAT